MITRIKESAALLLALGIVLYMPPLALIFAKTTTILGIPMPVFYLFGLWLVLIIGVWLISRQLPRSSSK